MIQVLSKPVLSISFCIAVYTLVDIRRSYLKCLTRIETLLCPVLKVDGAPRFNFGSPKLFKLIIGKYSYSIMNKIDFFEEAKKVFEVESNAIYGLSHNLDDSFNVMISELLVSKGRLIVCGMGKSGIVGKKIAATLASTGTPSFSMHPGEAYHGDLGMVTPDDVFLAISNSGETEEVVRLLPFLRDNKNLLISMTGNPNSTLAQYSKYHLDISVDEEACPLKLAPTTSTTASMAMGDALAVCLMVAKKFAPENFARFHPGGSLGKKLLSRVVDVASTDIPICHVDTEFKDVVSVINSGRMGACLVYAIEGTLTGVITDGDLRRSFESTANVQEMLAENIMTTTPYYVDGQCSLVEARELMEEKKVTFLLVADKNNSKPSYVSIYDL